ncbi:MAG TPA: hypothetical protein VFU63_04615, partial [Ktedonobacterales bacterium]|nr:hypothetical protein [Ktedonobacterales bacterium]
PNPPSSVNSSRHRAAPYGQPERDFGMPHAGTAQRGAPSRKQPAARPLDNQEMPAWLRNDSPDPYGQAGAPGYPPGRQQRSGASWNGYDNGGQDGYDGHGGYNGQNGQQAPRGNRGQHGQSWGVPDDDDSSPWARRPSSRHGARPADPADKKRKGGILGFFRRG